MARFVGGPFGGDLYLGDVKPPHLVKLKAPADWRTRRAGDKPATEFTTAMYGWDGEHHLKFLGQQGGPAHNLKVPIKNAQGMYEMPPDRDPEAPLIDRQIPSIPQGPT